MPSRRLSTSDNLSPLHEIAVNPYSSYNSNNVNQLTRMITGEKERDFVASGLDVFGTCRVEHEVVGTQFVNDNMESYDSTTFEQTWHPLYNGTIMSFDIDAGGGNKKAITKKPVGVTYFKAEIWKEITDIDSFYLNRTFKITFKLLIGTPRYLYVSFGGETKCYKYPQPVEGTDNYELYLRYTNPYDNVGNTLPHPILKFTVEIDELDTYCDPATALDDITLTHIVNPGVKVDPIEDNGINENDIPEVMLHPHEQIWATPGVCIKDEAVIEFIGRRPDTIRTGEPSIVLNYSDDTSWIKGQAFQNSDFPDGTVQRFMAGSSPLTTVLSSGELVADSLDDGETSGPRKVDGKNDATNHAYVKWAYLCVYYSYYKNPIANKAYIGLAKEDEVNDTRYGEDYLILAKIRFIDKSTADAIIYYPKEGRSREDWGYIDATRVEYEKIQNATHWMPEGAPVNSSIALDTLASKIYNFKGMLYFPTHDRFISWRNKEIPIGTGHGPDDYYQWIYGIDPNSCYDLVVYIIETNTFWRSKIRTKVEDGNIVPDYSDHYNLQVDWYEVTWKRFEVNWSERLTDNSAEGYSNWSTPTPDPWLWYDGTGSIPADSDFVDASYFTTIISNAAHIDKTAAEARASWPHQYYVVKGTGPCGTTIVNPFNMYGTGTVPGPKANDVKFNKFLRADNTWQFTRGGAILFENYIEFKSWYLAANTSYFWNDPVGGHYVEKVGRVPEIDYSVMCFVISDSTWWRSPLSPAESGGSLGDGWANTWPEATPGYNNVPNEFKPLTNEFEIRWGDSDGDWPGSIPASWQWATLSIDTNGNITYTLGGALPHTNLSEVKQAFPKQGYIVTNPTLGGNFRIVNPYNPFGNNLVPGPLAEETRKNLFLRSDGKWAKPGAGAGNCLIFTNYQEFCNWYHAFEDLYVFGGLTKTGRRGDDYNTLIYVISDSSWWRTPNPESGENWENWIVACSVSSNRSDVPKCIKPVLEEFEVRWGDLPSDWPGSIPVSWQWATIAVDTNGNLIYSLGGSLPHTNYTEVKSAFPKESYVVVNPNYGGNFRIVNPYNPFGNGLVPGPTATEVQDNKFLRSDGVWSAAGALDLHFEAKGYLTPIDNLVQGMCGHNGILKGVHIWSDVPINQSVANGLKVDILLTKQTTGSGAVLTVTIGGGMITNIGITSGGSGFDSDCPPRIRISGDGSGAKAHAVISGGVITNIVIDDQGSGYSTATAATDVFITKSIFTDSTYDPFSTGGSYERWDLMPVPWNQYSTGSAMPNLHA